MRPRPLSGLLVLMLAATACGGDDGSASSGPTLTDTGGSTRGEEPVASVPGGGQADGTITVDIGTFELTTTSCELRAGVTNAIAISAVTQDNAYTFTAGGFVNAITIGFEETGTDNVWTVIFGTPTVDGNTFSYEGPALRTVDGVTDPATSMNVDIQC